MQKPKNMFLHKLTIMLGVVAPLIGTFYAIVLLWNQLVSWNDIVIMLVMYVLTGLGITVGYHRMLTHRSFEPHPVAKFFFLALGSMAVQGPAYHWAAVHIKHHAHTDEEDDPHSPVEGFFHAHVGWLFLNGLYVTGDYGKWLKKDRMVMFFTKTFLFWVVLGYLLPYLFGGWTAVLWGGLVRSFLNNHVTWSVNSVCHVFGSRMFTTKDMSRNHWLVGLLAFGEGWHNNHHAFPRAAFHGMRWYQFDLSAYVIRLLERVGLAQKVWRVPTEKFQARLASNPASVSLINVDEAVA